MEKFKSKYGEELWSINISAGGCNENYYSE